MKLHKAIEDVHEAGRVPLGRDVAPAVGPGGTHNQEGGVGDERAAVVVERRALLGDRPLAGVPVQLAQVALARDRSLAHRPTSLASYDVRP